MSTPAKRAVLSTAVNAESSKSRVATVRRKAPTYERIRMLRSAKNSLQLLSCPPPLAGRASFALPLAGEGMAGASGLLTGEGRVGDVSATCSAAASTFNQAAL